MKSSGKSMLRRYGLRHEDLARFFGYKSVHSFRSSSAHGRLVSGCEQMLEEFVSRARARL